MALCCTLTRPWALQQGGSLVPFGARANPNTQLAHRFQILTESKGDTANNYHCEASTLRLMRSAAFSGLFCKKLRSPSSIASRSPALPSSARQRGKSLLSSRSAALFDKFFTYFFACRALRVECKRNEHVRFRATAHVHATSRASRPSLAHPLRRKGRPVDQESGPRCHQTAASRL
jgi:hypothetical protein